MDGASEVRITASPSTDPHRPFLPPQRFVPVFFDADITTGRAKLTGKGQTAVDEELQLKDHPR